MSGTARAKRIIQPAIPGSKIDSRELTKIFKKLREERGGELPPFDADLLRRIEHPTATVIGFGNSAIPRGTLKFAVRKKSAKRRATKKK